MSYCLIFTWFKRMASIRHQCMKATVLSCQRCLINTGVENEWHLNTKYFDYQMSLSKGKCWNSNNCLQFQSALFHCTKIRLRIFDHLKHSLLPIAAAVLDVGTLVQSPTPKTFLYLTCCRRFDETFCIRQKYASVEWMTEYQQAAILSARQPWKVAAGITS